MIEIVNATSPEQIATAGKLFFEYAASIKVSLCFENLDKEVAGLPGLYASPHGRLLLAMSGSRVAGCIALKKVDDDVCEMKRLFVRQELRGQGIGKKLTRAIWEEALALGYKRMRLDTLPSMKEAIAMYRSLGFQPIPPYRELPVPGALFMEVELNRTLYSQES